MTSVLDGIRVLDLSSGIAGPVAGMLLADHGADVVKVEPPGGDPRRGSPGYDTWLRGRRSAELDLHDSADRTTFLALARTADVLLESFSPGVTQRLGIDAATRAVTELSPPKPHLSDSLGRPASRMLGGLSLVRFFSTCRYCRSGFEQVV